MKYARLLLLLPALGALGCPDVGDWDEPLGPVRLGHIDSKLVGEWRYTGTEDKGPGRLTITAFDKNQYVMTVSAPAEKKTSFYRAFTTTVSGYDVMNLKELDADPGDGAWFYARFQQPQAGHLEIGLLRTAPLDGTPDDVESRRQAIGDLYPEPSLWQSLMNCTPLEDSPEENDAAAKTATTPIALDR